MVNQMVVMDGAVAVEMVERGWGVAAMGVEAMSVLEMVVVAPVLPVGDMEEEDYLMDGAAVVGGVELEIAAEVTVEQDGLLEVMTKGDMEAHAVTVTVAQMATGVAGFSVVASMAVQETGTEQLAETGSAVKVRVERVGEGRVGMAPREVGRWAEWRGAVD